MSKSVRSRRLIALAAAYLVALQALLLPLTVAMGKPLDPGLCAASASVDGSQPPASHEDGCPCAAGCGMQCCGQVAIGPAQIEIALGPTGAAATTAAPAIETIIRPADKGPQVPRAPPAA